MPAEFGLLEDRLILKEDFEASTARGNHFDLGVGEAFFDLVRQTGGSWLIVSNHAVFNTDLHRCGMWSALLGRGRILLGQLKCLRSSCFLERVDRWRANHTLPHVGR